MKFPYPWKSGKTKYFPFTYDLTLISFWYDSFGFLQMTKGWETIFKSFPHDHNVHVKHYLKLVSRWIETLDTKTRPVFETFCSFLCTRLSDKSFSLFGYSALQLAYCNIGEGSSKLLWPVWDPDSTPHTKIVLHDFQERSLLWLSYIKLPSLFSFPFLSCSLFPT